MEMNQNILSVLLLCLHQETKPSDVEAAIGGLSKEGWQDLIDLSGKLGVKSHFFLRLKALNLSGTVPHDQLEGLRKNFLSNAARNIIYKNEVVQIAKQFQLYGVSLIVLKGMFLASFVYDNLAAREMSDIDLLVRVSELGQAAKALEYLGYKAEKPYKIENATSVAHHLPPFIKQGKGIIELHWNIISLVGNEPVDIDELWKRVISHNLNEVPVFGLCPEDLLLHICGHASYHHKFEVGLRTLVDIVEITDHYFDLFDWDQFVQNAHEWHWERGAYLVLRLAKELLGAMIPDEVLLNLRPGSFKEYLYDIALSQMVSDDPLVRTITYPLADWHVASFWGKVSIFWRRLFLPKPLLADHFHILPNSPIIYFYYPIRFFDLLARYVGVTYKLWRRDKYTAPFVKRKGLLQRWMHEEE